MAGIHVYSRLCECHDGPHNYRIFRPNILGNPYTHLTRETKASFIVKTREDAVDEYRHYFDIMYGNNIAFTKEVDKIYNDYKSGNDVYLECYCKGSEYGEACHGEVIAEKLQRRLFKEKFKNLKNEK